MTFATQLQAAFEPVSTGYDSGLLGIALSWVESFVTEYCNRDTFDVVVSDVELVDPYFGPRKDAMMARGSATLHHVPITEISSVEGWLPYQGAMSWVTLSNYAFDPDTGYLYDTTGLIGTTVNHLPSWPWLPKSLQVTYTHGYDTVPQPLVDVACRLALQFLDNPSSAEQSRIGWTENSFGTAVNELDQKVLSRYTLLSIA